VEGLFSFSVKRDAVAERLGYRGRKGPQSQCFDHTLSFSLQSRFVVESV
jgi:hypothetical protein